MTAKRFKIKLSSIGELMDCETKTILATSDIADELIPLCDLLNDFYEEIQLLGKGLKEYENTLPLFLDCGEVNRFRSELFDFEMERMKFYKEHPNCVKEIIVEY